MTEINEMVMREISDTTKLYFVFNDNRTEFIILIHYNNKLYEYITQEDSSYGFEFFDVVGNLLDLFYYDNRGDNIEKFIKIFTKENDSYEIGSNTYKA